MSDKLAARVLSLPKTQTLPLPFAMLHDMTDMTWQTHVTIIYRWPLVHLISGSDTSFQRLTFWPGPGVSLFQALLHCLIYNLYCLALYWLTLWLSVAAAVLQLYFGEFTLWQTMKQTNRQSDKQTDWLTHSLTNQIAWAGAANVWMRPSAVAADLKLEVWLVRSNYWTITVTVFFRY